MPRIRETSNSVPNLEHFFYSFIENRSLWSEIAGCAAALRMNLQYFELGIIFGSLFEIRLSYSTGGWSPRHISFSPGTGEWGLHVTELQYKFRIKIKYNKT